MPGMDKLGLSPELKALIDRVIVPALVREYVAEKSLEPEPPSVAESDPISIASAEVRR